MLSNLLLILGGFVIIGLVPLVVIRARALDRRIQTHLADQAKGPKDPYAQMAELSRVQEAIQSQEKGQWPKG